MQLIIHQLRPLNTLRNIRRHNQIPQLTQPLKIQRMLINTILIIVLIQLVGNRKLLANRRKTYIPLQQ
jgi:hypothetical protein